MIIYYDRQGQPIYDTLEWSRLHQDKSYRVVKQEDTPLGKYWVSTVWLGIDHSFDWSAIDRINPKPIIFETMVFSVDNSGITDFSDGEQERYSTEQEALIGHEKMVKKYAEKEAKDER